MFGGWTKTETMVRFALFGDSRLAYDAWSYIQGHPEIHLDIVRAARRYFYCEQTRGAAIEFLASLFTASEDGLVRSKICEFYDPIAHAIEQSPRVKFSRLPKREVIVLPAEIAEALRQLPPDKFRFIDPQSQIDGYLRFAVIIYDASEQSIIFQQSDDSYRVPGSRYFQGGRDCDTEYLVKINLETWDVRYESIEVFPYSGDRAIGGNARHFNLKDPASISAALEGFSCPPGTWQNGPHVLVAATALTIFNHIRERMLPKYSDDDPQVRAVQGLIDFIERLY